MKDMHTDLGIIVNRMGIKSPLKVILRSMSDYDQATLEENDHGFCTSRDRVGSMCVKRILEGILDVSSSGYGLPFSLKHLNFFMSCKEGMVKLQNLSSKLEHDETRELAKTIMKHISRVTGDTGIYETAKKLNKINSTTGSGRYDGNTTGDCFSSSYCKRFMT